jgi:hypothetical protein
MMLCGHLLLVMDSLGAVRSLDSRLAIVGRRIKKATNGKN